MDIISKFNKESLTISLANESVKSWPLIGEKAYTLWSNASSDLQGFIKNYPEQVKASVGWFFNSITGLMGSIILSLIALIVAGVFMSSAKEGHGTAVAFANKLIDDKGENLIQMCVNTIRSVVKGIILVSVIQAGLAFIGFSMIGLPTAGILTFVVLVCAIV